MRLNPGSASFAVAELGKADIVEYSSAPCFHHFSSSPLQATKRDKESRPLKEMPAAHFRSTLYPSTGNWVLKVSHLTPRPTHNCHDNLSCSPQSCLNISGLLVPQDLKGQQTMLASLGTWGRGSCHLQGHTGLSSRCVSNEML